MVKICSILFRPAAVGLVLGAEWRTTTRFCKSEGFGMPTIAKQSYKQNYTDNVELSILIVATNTASRATPGAPVCVTIT